MLAICEGFASDHNILFNGGKSELLAVGCSQPATAQLFLNGQLIPWVDKCRHLGNWFNKDGNFVTDLNAKIDKFTTKVNVLLGRFGHNNTSVLWTLFLSKCDGFSGSNLWPLGDARIIAAYTRWNIACRRILRLHPWTHRRLIPGLMECLSIEQQLTKKFVKFALSCSQSKNRLVRWCFQYTYKKANSMLGYNYRHVLLNYADTFDQALEDILKGFRSHRGQLDHNLDLAKELLRVRESSLRIENFLWQETQDILTFVCIY